MEKVLTFVKPYLNFIDSGKFFEEPIKWLYMAIAALMLLFPFATLVTAINGGIFKYDGTLAIAFILVWVVMLAASALCATIWWNRKDDLTSDKNEFVAIPIVAHLIKTFGEVAGTFIAIMGVALAIIGTLFANKGDSLSQFIPGVSSFGIAGIVASPIIGYMTVLFSRYASEMAKVLAAIANNTKKSK